MGTKFFLVLCRNACGVQAVAEHALLVDDWTPAPAASGPVAVGRCLGVAAALDAGGAGRASRPARALPAVWIRRQLGCLRGPGRAGGTVGGRDPPWRGTTDDGTDDGADDGTDDGTDDGYPAKAGPSRRVPLPRRRGPRPPRHARARGRDRDGRGGLPAPAPARGGRRAGLLRAPAPRRRRGAVQRAARGRRRGPRARAAGVCGGGDAVAAVPARERRPAADDCADIAARMTAETSASGACVFRRGDVSKKLYVVLKGSVLLRRSWSAGPRAQSGRAARRAAAAARRRRRGTREGGTRRGAPRRGETVGGPIARDGTSDGAGDGASDGTADGFTPPRRVPPAGRGVEAPASRGVGEGFGIETLFLDAPRACDAVAASPRTRVLALTRRDLREILETARLLRSLRRPPSQRSAHASALVGAFLLEVLGSKRASAGAGLGSGRLGAVLTPAVAAELGRALTLTSLRPGERLFLEGDRGDAYHIVLRGEILISRFDPATGKRKRLAALRRGQGFGELALVSADC